MHRKKLTGKRQEMHLYRLSRELLTERCTQLKVCSKDSGEATMPLVYLHKWMERLLRTLH